MNKIFFIIIHLLIIYIKSFKYFKAFNLLSNNIIFITDAGIIKYDPESNSQTMIQETNIITSQSEQDYIQFAQSPLDEGGYVFCRLKNYIFIFDETLNINYTSFNVDYIINSYCVLVPYKTNEGKNTLIIGYITGNQKLKLLMYDLNIGSNDIVKLLNETEYLAKNSYGQLQNVLNKAISCELMHSSNYSNKILSCFIIDQHTYSICAINFNPENFLSFLYFSENVEITSGTSIINSSLSPNNTISLICFVNSQTYLCCLLYDSENNKLSHITNLFANCQLYSYNMGVEYIIDKQEYTAFCSSPSSNDISFIKFDNNFNIKDIDNDNSKCYNFFSIPDSQCYTLHSSYLLYKKNDKKYNMFRSCFSNEGDILSLLNISENCNTKIGINGLIDNNELVSTIPLLPTTILTTQISIISTLPLMPTTIITSQISISTLPLSPTTILTTPIPIISTIPLIPTTIITTQISIISTLPSTPTTIITSQISISTLPLSPTTILTTQISISTLPLSPTTVITSQISSIRSTTPNYIISTTEIKIESTELKAENQSTEIKISDLSSIPILISTTIPKTILISSSQINAISTEISSSKFSSHISTIITTSSYFSSLILSSLITNSISLSDNPTISSTTLYPSTKLEKLSSSSLVNNISYLNEKDNILKIYSYGDIIKGNINKNKEELEDSLDDIMKEIIIGKKYEINGNDYNITITPINDLDSFKSTFVDFSSCEEILRKKYNIPSEEVLTILQIEIDKINEKALTNQVEYAIYNEKKIKLDLSYCKNVNIKVTYEITNSSLLNKTMISQYSELGIDIFNTQDSFFNDICYPFSISNSDLILKDRVSDIYQNYSLCDNGCEYEQIDIQNMSVTCSCNIKTEINTEVSPPVFGEIVEDTFKDSNFGVIRCYNLVFSLDNKLHNIGFLILLLFVLAHIICFIIYFISGINSIVIFVQKEMEKNNYIIRKSNPKKKKNIRKKNIPENNSNSKNDFNSTLLIYQHKKNKIIQKNNKETKKNNKISKKDKTKSSNIKAKARNNQPIFIFNYKFDNNYYNSKFNSSKKHLNYNDKLKSNNRKKTVKYNQPISKMNKELKFPGYYNLIQINANNSIKNKPPESKFILDNYDYEEAIKYDKRDFWRIYFICLLSKENILNTFFFKSPLEIQSIRLSIFIFSYSCDFALNAVFYLNQNISDKYHYEGDSLYIFTIVNNMTISVFSTIFSYLLVKSLNILTNSKESIEILFRKEEKKMRKNKEYKVNKNAIKNIYTNLLKVYKNMKIKIIFYIIIEFLLMIFFLYFVTAFCEVYKDTQLSWLYDSFISFILSIPIELLISFVISLLYIVSIRMKIKFLYNFVLFLYGLG